MSLTDAPSPHVVTDPRTAELGAQVLLAEVAVSIFVWLVPHLVPSMLMTYGAFMVMGAMLTAGYALLGLGTTERSVGMLAAALAGVLFLVDTGWFFVEFFSHGDVESWVTRTLGFAASVVGLAVLAAGLFLLWRVAGASRPWLLWVLLAIAAVRLVELAFSLVLLPWLGTGDALPNASLVFRLLGTAMTGLQFTARWATLRAVQGH